MTKQYTKYIVSLVWLLAAFDAASTVYVISYCGAKEANPLMDVLIQQGNNIFIFVKMILTTFCLFILYSYKSFKLTKLALHFCCAIYFVLALYHIIGIVICHG